MQKLPDSYLFKSHTRDTLAAWARQLHYFYFIRAWGGHANEDDTFQAGICFKDKADVLVKLTGLGITPGVIGPYDPQPLPGQSYRGDVLAKFKRAVKKYPDMEQPGLVVIAGQKVFVTVGSTAINFSISGTADDNIYEVSEADFAACLELEKVFDQLNWQYFKDSSFEQMGSCVSPITYPELF